METMWTVTHSLSTWHDLVFALGKGKTGVDGDE